MSLDRSSDDGVSSNGGDIAPTPADQLGCAATTIQVVRRLVIQTIMMHNFKSYAGTHIVGPFHKTFTAVIGPNGSGKSNVIDAMLFVFGKQAKKIRLEKLSELIHSSAAFPNLTSASVTVNFVEIQDDPQDQSRWTEVGGTAFSVTREVNRNNTSQYFIDGSKVTQKQVVADLIARGIDLEHNRFLILQGEVEQIALMKPKAEKEGEEGLLEYFDDLIGTNRYIESINAASAAADKCQEERLSSLDQLEKVRKEREALESAKDQTVRYTKKDNLLQKLLSVMCQVRVREHESKLEEPRRVIAAFDAELQQINSARAEHHERKKAIQQQMKASQKVLVAQQKERELVQGRLAKAEDEVAAAKANAEDAEKLRKKEADKLKKLGDECSKLRAEEEENTRNANFATKQLADAQAELDDKAPELERCRDQVQQLVLPKRKELEQARREAAPFEKAVAEAEIARDTARNALEDCSSAMTQAQQDHARALTDRDRVAARLAQVRATLSESESHKKGMLTRFGELESQIDHWGRRKHEVNHQINIIKAQWRENEVDDKIVNFLSGHRNLGYHGTLRQLGNLDDKYDVAAGVAGAATWGYHVVDDQSKAAEAMALLRQHNLGRATFLPLDKITRDMEVHLRDPVTPPPGCERLFDLIRCDKVYTPLFYYAVRNTLVTADFTLARQIGLGKNGGPRARVVTLDGVLVEPGAVTGGGSALPQGARLRATHGSIDRNVAKEKLTELQGQLKEACDQELHFKQEREAQAVAHRGRVLSRQDEDQLSTECRTLESQLKQATARVDVATRDLEHATQLHSSAAIKRAEEQLSFAEGALVTAEQQQLRYRQKIKHLQQEIDNVGGPELAALRDRVAELQGIVKSQEAKLASCNAAAQRARISAERKVKDAESLRLKLEESSEAAAAATRNELATLTAQANELKEALQSASAAAQAAQAAVAVFERDIEDVDTQVKALDERQHTVDEERKEKLDSISQQLVMIEKLNTKIASCEEKIVHNVLDFGVETWADDDGLDAGKRRSDGNDGDDDNATVDVDDRRRNVAAPPQRTESETEEMFRNGSFTTRVDASVLLSYCQDETAYMVRMLTEELQRIKDTIDFHAVSRWREKDTLYKELRLRYDELLAQLEAAEQTLLELKEERKTKFMAVFTEIQKKLKQMYQLLANGGDAEIELLDSSDPFEGINFVVRPPKKAWKAVSNLSGGEKTLSSLALVFALHHVKPTPVYVMDEIDAALDFRNVSIVARYVLEKAIGAQFIIISLRNNMFELAHQLVGICKVDDCTRSVVVNPSAIASHIVFRAHQQQAQRQAGRKSLLVADAAHLALDGNSGAADARRKHRAEVAGGGPAGALSS